MTGLKHVALAGLERSRQQATFAALDVDPGFLNRMGVVDGDRGMILRQLMNLGAALLRLVQAGRRPWRYRLL